MSSVDLTVWFVCKSCKLYFAKVNGFIDHKKESHFTEFQIQNTGCIVFEERIDGNFNSESSSVEREPIIPKEESQLTNDSQIETDDDPDPSVIGCFDDPNLPWKITDFPPQTEDSSCAYSEPTTDFLVPKTELVTYESDTEEADTSLVDPLVQYKHNPINVLVKRLTSPEIVASSSSSSSADNLELKLNKHLKTQSVSASFKCHHLNCGKVLKSIRGFRNHLKVTHSNSRPFRCPNPNCDLTFKKSSDLKAHMIRHSNDRPFGCPQCGKTFKLRYDLVEHVRSHTGERPYKCPVENCGKSFAKSTTFCRHKRSMHHIK